MKRSEQINEIAAALSKAQGQMGNAIKSSLNPYHRSRYADYTSITDAIREPFSKNGLAYMQEPTTTGDQVSITTLIIHSSGQWIEFDAVTFPVSKKDPQSFGSAMTYAKRYALGSIVGIGSAEDDDAEGEAEMQEDRKSTKQSPPSPAPDDFITKDQITELNTLWSQLPSDRQKAYNDMIKTAFGAVHFKDIKTCYYNKAKITLENAINNSRSTP